MLKRKVALMVLSIVLAFAFIAASALAVLFNTDSSPDLLADSSAGAAGITPATSFDKLSNGSIYYYTQPTSTTQGSVTVKSSDAHGSKTNPFVINTKEQWVFFANVITKQTAGYTGNQKFWILGNDINLAGNSIDAVGVHSTGFQGTLFGNKHSISNGTIKYAVSVLNPITYACGLFHFINGGSVYDLTIESNLKYTMKTDIVGNNSSSYDDKCQIEMGCLNAFSHNSLFVNINVKASISVSNTSTVAVSCNVGGIMGFSRNTSIYKSTFTGSVYYKVSSSDTFRNGNGVNVGGILGNDHGTGAVIIDSCYIAGSVIAENNGSNLGGIMGFPKFCPGSLTISNCVINAVVKMLGNDKTMLNDVGLVCGEDMFQAKGDAALTPLLKNIYLLGNAKVYRGSADTTGAIFLFGNENGGPLDVINACSSGVYIPVGSSATIYPANQNASSANKKSGSVANVVTEANKNQNITNNFTISSNGAVSGKLSDNFTITYIPGAGATWTGSTAAPKTYTKQTSAKTITAGVSTAPTRPGYTFKGWSIVSPTSTGTLGKYTIPANQTGNLCVYAVWELKAFGGTAPTNQTITYGNDVTFDASKVTHEAGTSNANYGVTLSYQWQDANGKNISGATSSTYKLTKPAYTAGTNYKVVVTATPKDAATAPKSTTYTVKLVVNKQGVTLPTAATGLVYSGNEQTGVSTTNTLITLGGVCKATDAGTYTATAALPNANYCWGKDGGTDSAQKNIPWTIAKATVAVPSITAGASQVYTGGLLKPTTTTDKLYTVTNNGETEAGKHTVTVTLNTPKNYKWATAPASGESGAYTLNWEITKADITLTAPTYTSDSVDGKTYVGQLISNLTITQSTGTHVRKGSSDNVEGTYTFKDAASTRIAADTTGYTVVFTPNDTANYNSAEITMAVSPVQLYLRVRELTIEFLNVDGGVVDFDTVTIDMSKPENIALARTIVNTRRVNNEAVLLPVDYNSTFKLSDLNVARDTQVNGVALSWQLPAGYDMKFYTGVDGSNNGVGMYGDGDSTAAFTSDITVYLGYAAKEVEYTVVTVKQSLGNNTPTNAEILAGVDKLPIDQAECVEVQTLKALAGTNVSFPVQTIEGFTRKNSLTADGDRTFVSDDRVKFVLGTGHTILITYYERNSYTVTWNFSGGTVKTDTSTISNRMAYSLKFGAPFTRIADPEYTGYTFDTWYLDSACTQQAMPLPTVMPARNITLYGGRTSVVYTLEFDYALDRLAESLGLPTLLEGYEPTTPADSNGPATYTIEQIINSGLIRLGTPVMTGFKFAGWVYFDEDDLTMSNPHSISTINKAFARNYKLYATWTPFVYTVTLDTNGGNRLTTSSVRIPNLSYFPTSIGGMDFDAADFIKPVRAGYEFLGWCYKNDAEELIPISEYDLYNYLKHGTDLFADWKAKPVKIAYADNVQTSLFDIAIKSTGAADPDAKFFPEDTENGEYLYKDSVLTIDITPIEGWEITSITISGISFSNHGRFTVRTYENDTMVIDVKFNKIRYNINYVFNGGTYLGSEAYPRSFEIADEVKIFGGSNISRLGYTFTGWLLNNPDEGEPVCDCNADWSVVGTDFLGAGNITLYATWTPARVKMVYHSNYAEDVIEEQESADIVTGARIPLWQPESAPFVPVNRELIGWSLTPGGDIAYNISYKYVTGDNGKSEFVPQPAYYTVQSDVNNINNLYAVWRVTNVQYLTFEADNNNTTFSTDASYTGVSLTARPRYAYEQESGLSMIFKWYKVDPNWDKWTEADLEGLEGDALNQAQSYVGMYKIPADATPLRVSDTLTYVAPEDQFHTFAGIRNVADAGLYICSLTAKGSYQSPSTGQIMTSEITMFGQYEVIINKADLPRITLATPEAPSVYNGNVQGLTVVTPNPVAGVWTIDSETGAYRLPDGSQLKVTYTYVDNKTSNQFENGVTDVGDYHVVAKFEFVKDKGNYNLPDQLNAEFEIAQREISDVKYTIESLIEGVWTEVADFKDNVYSRNPFRIVATPLNVVEGDLGKVAITMLYDGDLDDNYTAPVNVGNYTAYCDALTGDRAANYRLSSSLMGREFNIIKATHNIEITFNDVTTVYDGQKHELAIDSIIENGDTEHPVEITDTRIDKSSITLADGCTIELTWTVDYDYVDARFNEANGSRRGGIHAGVYTVTVSFADDENNAINFNALDDITATLTISQAVYSGDGVNAGLSDEQLNRKTADGQPNPNGFGDNHSVNFNTDTVYNPQLNLDPDYFNVAYTYQYMAQGSNTFAEYTTDDFTTLANGQKGMREAGLYRITASITYNSVQYANDYNAIANHVVELKIMPGSIEKIIVEYNQAEHEKTILSGPIKYGDGFGFEDQNLDGYYVKVIVKYADNGGQDIIDNTKAQFFGEDGKPFNTFDRATIDGEGNLIDPQKGDYRITVAIYGSEGYFDVKVRQQELHYDNIGFDESDKNLGLNGGEYRYEFSYDGQKRIPALDSDNGAYNFVGITGETLAAEKDITALYEYTTDATVTSASTWQAIPEGGFADAGVYNIRVTFTNQNSNYKPLDVTHTRLFCKITISSKVITSDDIIWQYSTNESFTNPITLKNDNLVYCGVGGYYVKAVFRNLAQNNESAPDYYLPVEEIALKGSTEEREHIDIVKIVDANRYVIEIKALQSGNNNYRMAGTFEADITIDPAKVDLTWTLAGGVNALTYNGKDQLATGVSVHYTPDASHGTSAKPITVKVDNESDPSFVNAGSYTLKATLTDTNYVPNNDTFYVTINPIKVTEDNTTITWWYVDGERKEQQIENADIALEYVGADIRVFVKYSVQGDDAGTGVVDGMRTADAHDADGNAPRNAGTYELSLNLEGNYDLTGIKHNFEITKKAVEVEWLDKDTVYTYNGKEQAVRANALGVGEESADTIIVLSGDMERNANQGTNTYAAVATLGSDYANNYTLVGAAADGSVTFSWTIGKKAIEVEWTTDGLVYNNGYALNDWSGVVSNLQSDEEGNVDTAELTLEIYRGLTKVDEITSAGEYTIKIVGISNGNYSFDGIEARAVTVAKATPVISNVVYKEYADNITYQNAKLRNEKLVYESKYADSKVAGQLTFNEGADLSQIGSYAFYCTFTPTDTSNYNTVENVRLNIEVKEDIVARLGYDHSTVPAVYTIGQGFVSNFVVVYFEHASYYEETVNNKVVSYGRREEIDRKATPVSFSYNFIDITKGYTFTKKDLTDSEGTVSVIKECTIRMIAQYNGEDIYGEINFKVSAATPTQMTITNKEELAAGKYYVGSTFDKTLAVISMEYEDSSLDGIIPASDVELINATLPETPGEYTLTFVYFRGTQYEVRDTVTITVSDKETIETNLTEKRTLKWTGEALTLKVLTKDGEALPEGVTYKVVDHAGNPVTMIDKGVYEIIVRFTVDETKYKPIEDVRVTVTVKENVAELDEKTLVVPAATRTYTGNALTSSDYILKNIRVVDEAGNSDIYTWDASAITYTVNGKDPATYTICNAGTYNFVATIPVSANDGSEFDIIYEYTIVIEKAANTIDTFTINGWIEGATASEIAFNSTFGKETVLYVFYRLNADGERELVGAELPTEAGKYVAVATVPGTSDYETATLETTFTVTKAQLDPGIKDEEGKDKINISTPNGVDPTYELKVEELNDEYLSGVSIKNQVIMLGYNIDIVDAKGNVVANPGEYTVKLLLTSEQRSAKHIKVFSVDENGKSTEITNSTIDEDGYLVFTTSNFDGNFVVTSRDADAVARTAWIVGAVVAVAAIAAVVVVVIIKKKRSN